MPTEKDVQYYSELVQREVGKQKSHFTCFDCLAKEGLCYPGTTKGGDGKCRRCGAEGKDIGKRHRNDDWIDEIRPHHRLLRGKQNLYHIVFFVDRICYMASEKDVIDNGGIGMIGIPRDLTKPYSGQSDDIKIELGKIVEEVLLYKEK